MLHEVLLIVGMVIWFAAIAIEYCLKFRLFNHQIPGPCMIERNFTAHNLLFVAFPLALILVAEIHFANEIGSMGLICITETFSILGITAYEKYRRMHVPFCIITGIAHILMYFNISLQCGLITGIPLAVMGLAVVAFHSPEEDYNHANTYTSIIFWLMDTWVIFDRTIFLIAKPTDHVNHFLFDLIGSSIVAALLMICFVTRQDTGSQIES